MLYPLQAAQLIESTMSMLGVEGLRVTRESKENQFQCVCGRKTACFGPNSVEPLF